MFKVTQGLGKSVKELFSLNFACISVGEFLSCTGSAMSTFAIVWWLAKNSNMLNLSVMVGLQVIVQLLSSVLLAGFIETHNKKWIACASDLLNFVILLYLAWLMYFSLVTTFQLYLVAVIGSIVDSAYKIATSTVSLRLFSGKHYQQLSSIRAILRHISRIAAPAIGGVVLAFASFWVIFILDAVSYLISAILFIFVKYEEQTNDIINSGPGIAGYFGDLRNGLQVIWKNNIGIIFLLLVLQNFVVTPFFLFLPGYVVNVLKSDSTTFAILESILTAGSMIIYVVALFYSPGRHLTKLFGLGAGIQMFVFLGLAFLPNFPMTVSAVFFYGAVLAVSGISSSMMIRHSVPKDQMNKIGLLYNIYECSFPVAIFLGGILVSTFSFQHFLMILSALSLVTLYFSINHLPESLNAKENVCV